MAQDSQSDENRCSNGLKTNTQQRMEMGQERARVACVAFLQQIGNNGAATAANATRHYEQLTALRAQIEKSG